MKFIRSALVFWLLYARRMSRTARSFFAGPAWRPYLLLLGAMGVFAIMWAIPKPKGPQVIAYDRAAGVGAAITLPSQIKYKADGSNAATRTLASKLADRININDFSGSDFCAQLSNAMAALPTGGTIDARSTTGTVACASNPFLGVTQAVTVQLGDATIQTTVPWVIATSAIHLYGAGTRTTYQYTGGATAYAFKVGTAAPLTTQIQDIVLDKMIIKGNASSTDGLLIAGVFRSFFTELNIRDVTGACVHTQWSVVNTMKSIHCSTFDFLGAFTVQPTNGFYFDQIDVNHQTTASTCIDCVAEGVSGSGIKLTGAVNMVFTAGTSESNGRGLELTSIAQRNTFIGIDLESNSTEDALINGSYNSFSGISSTGLFHIASPGGFNTLAHGGIYQSVQIDSGCTANYFDGIYNYVGSGTFTDNGTDTRWSRKDNATAGTMDNDRVSSPNTGWSGFGTPTRSDLLTGSYSFTSTPTLLSNTVLTAATPWVVLFIGVWGNNVDGGGLAQIAPYAEVTSGAPTLVIGSVTITVSLNGSNQVQLATGANNAFFNGRIIVIPNPLGAAGADSIKVKGNVIGGAMLSNGAITSTGKYTTYNNVVTAGYGIPAIHGTPVLLTAQTADKAATNVYAAAPVGEYRVCATARTTTSGTGTTANLNIIWTDEGGVKTDAVGTWALNSVTVTGQINKCEYIHAAAASNIQVSVTAGTYGTSVYALSATAERLN